MHDILGFCVWVESILLIIQTTDLGSRNIMHIFGPRIILMGLKGDYDPSLSSRTAGHMQCTLIKTLRSWIWGRELLYWFHSLFLTVGSYSSGISTFKGQTSDSQHGWAKYKIRSCLSQSKKPITHVPSVDHQWVLNLKKWKTNI